MHVNLSIAFCLFLRSMKKIFLGTFLLSFLSVGLYAQDHSAPATPQNVPARPPAPYLKDTELPDFKILETDSATYFHTGSIPTGKRSVLIFFDPGCSHCINFLDKLFPAMDSFKNVNFYMMSVVHDVSKLAKFENDYHIENYKNIKIVGKDVDFFFISHYGIQRFPGAAIYDKHKNIVKLLESDEVTVAALYEHTH